MKEIISLSNPYIKYLEKLYDKKTRELEGLYIVEGYHLVNEAREVNLLKTALITTIDNQIDDVENIIVTKDIIKKLSKTKNPQDIIGICYINKKNTKLGNRVLVLDNINDPGNLGTLLRAALGFNFNDIIISNDTVDLYNDKVIRSAQGAHFKLNIIKTDLLEYLKILKDKGYKIIATSLESAKYLKDLEPVEKCAVILGNEANGVSSSVILKSDINVKININERLESLNVSIAGAIIMHHINEWM